VKGALIARKPRLTSTVGLIGRSDERVWSLACFRASLTSALWSLTALKHPEQRKICGRRKYV